ncbi:aminodeoxychorismate lyase [Mycolicibacterium sp.]|uniref:aminodeoxychorismate lyase n=1 Tax=Mycolicibacterium sp. TaxID=2320850 RepID=UPI001A1FDEF1|nr:aminodeoxychorismate lyase [Mycolicibacterium sp.]MBJ7339924.1 aminodeoxychorismate lyase [Mycolicibacterium sp.]
MAAHGEIVVTLDGEVVPADHPVGHVDDPMFTRGDGVFETLLLRGGRVCLVDAHLERLARSAEIVGLPRPDPARWRAATDAAAASWTGDGDAVLRMVWGRRSHGGATGFVTVSRLPDRVPAARRDGVSAMTLDRGVAAAGPWSVAGAKSLSYASYAAALRHADRLGIDEVVLVSADGFVLEGPRSSVVIADRDGVLATPSTTLPILPGITVQAVFDVARARGTPCEERLLRVSDLVAAQGVWLLSSVTLAARIRVLDGVRLRVAGEPVEMAALVDEAVAGEP